jgi:hypothetical protein
MKKTLVIGPGWLRSWRPSDYPRERREPPKPPQEPPRPDGLQKRRVADFLRQGRVARREALKAAAGLLYKS